MATLRGHRILVTRSGDDSADWAEALAAEGADAIVFPCIDTENVDNPALNERLAAAVDGADWLVFTSRRGVDAYVSLIGRKLPTGLRCAAVGGTTAARVEKLFGRVELIGGGNAMALGRALAADPSIAAGARCVLVLAENARTFLERTLTEAGGQVERYNLYRTIPAEPIDPKHRLSALGCDTVLFASPTAVTGFVNQVNVDKPGQMVTIGPTTSAAVRAQHWEVTAEAKEPSLSGIIDSLLERERE
jgi:uroporphyrinogen-III synthase